MFSCLQLQPQPQLAISHQLRLLLGPTHSQTHPIDVPSLLLLLLLLMIPLFACTSCSTNLVCCDPEDNVNYPNRADGGYPEGLNWVENASPAGKCVLHIVYSTHGDLSHDGLCVGKVTAEW
jgi:hypothetical protein